MVNRFQISVVAALLMMAVTSGQAMGVMVNDPWVRAAPPNAPALAIFMTLENHTNADLALVDVRTDLPADKVEMHRTIMADGMMKMIQQKEMPVASHGSLVLQPGSWHIMIIGPKSVPVAGETVGLALIFSDGSEKQATASVRKGGMKGRGHQMMHHHHH